MANNGDISTTRRSNKSSSSLEDSAFERMNTTSTGGSGSGAVEEHEEIYPMQNGQTKQQQGRRRGNVQMSINGRYIPQLDMIFSTKKSNISSSAFSLGGSGSGNDEPSCRFVNGNGLRPSTPTLIMLIEQNGSVELGGNWRPTMEQTCTCHESIRNSEHHLCTQQRTQPPSQSRRGAILNYGRNLLRYTLISEKGITIATAEAYMYLWKSVDSVVVSDVDGTVTKSDVWGVIDSVLQDKFEHIHKGICQFYHKVMDIGIDNGNHGEAKEESRDKSDGQIRFLYLSSRPISLVSQTRKLLLSLSQACPQNNMYGLPPGPILCHTGPLSSVLYSELVTKDIYQFKADVLARQVVLPFVAARGEDWKNNSSRRRTKSIDDRFFEERTSRDMNLSEHDVLDRNWSGMSVVSLWDDRLFLAGFGNKVTDAIAYEMAGIDRHDIYIIDKESRILCMGLDNGRGRTEEGRQPNLTGVFCEQPECNLAAICCPGMMEGQTELSAPALDNKKLSASATTTNTVATTIHSIELSLPDENQPTSVDIYVTNDQLKSSSNTGVITSKRAKFKQSIRAFSSKMPSLRSISSSDSKAPKKLYEGYDDPLLLNRIRERIRAEP